MRGARGGWHEQKLVLRQGFITEIKGLDHLTGLTYLDLYENHVSATERACVRAREARITLRPCPPQIKFVGGLDKLVNLTYLDVSFNECRLIQVGSPPLSPLCERGRPLSLARMAAQGVEHNTALKELYLVNNKLPVIPPGALSSLRSLRLLELGSNRIRVRTVLGTAVAELARACADDREP